MNKGKRYLVTGAAGFIGFHVVRRLVRDGNLVTGFDNINDYYDVKLKKARLGILQKSNSFKFVYGELANEEDVNEAVSKHKVEVIINLAAQAGVRYSLENPRLYIDSNVAGFANVLEAARKHKVKHVLYASSSSVYGANEKQCFSVGDVTDTPVSLYAATKKSNELMAYAYSHLYGLPTTGVRLFTVYGPFGRPDMAPFLFTKKILNGEPISLFNHGKMKRDFTYIDDVVEAMVGLLGAPPAGNTPSAVYNIGTGNSVSLGELVKALEEAAGRSSRIRLCPLQPGDVIETCADVQTLVTDIRYKPQTTVDEGARRFVRWYQSFYGSEEEKA